MMSYDNKNGVLNAPLEYGDKTAIVSVKDIYGKPFHELTPPEGKEFTGDFRVPPHGQEFLAAGSSARSNYTNVSNGDIRGPRLWIRDKQPHRITLVEVGRGKPLKGQYVKRADGLLFELVTNPDIYSAHCHVYREEVTK